MISSLADFQHPFFIGVAGTGMSAIAQWLQGSGKQVSGSDRFFKPGDFNETREKLEQAGILCFLQDGEGITDQTDLVVYSTAVEDTVLEIQLAKKKNIPMLSRAEMLSLIAGSKKTIAVAGTSGKSTTSAMLFTILEQAGMDPGIISGAGLVQLIRQGKIGNAWAGKGDWLVIEADESDGSVVQYKPEIGIILNVDKDHKEIDSLMDMFLVFSANSKKVIVNRSHTLASQLSKDENVDFSTDTSIPAGYRASHFRQEGFSISFTINDIPFHVDQLGKHNMENAIAAVAAARMAGVDLNTCSAALKNYAGIYRRHQLLGTKNGVIVIDDFAHNPVKCATAIVACQPLAPKVIAWFQPHGYGPTRFLKNDFVKEIAAVLRPEDEIWMSEIFYAGGTTTKDISAADLINEIRDKGKNAFFVSDRSNLLDQLRSHLNNDCVLLLMGARDPSLEAFAKSVWENL